MHACRSRFQLKTRRSTPHCAVPQIATVLHCMAPKRRLSGSCVGSDPWETLFKDHWKQCTDNGLPPWELGPYGHLDYNSTVDPLGLLQCQALLRLLFTHCPTGIVNHLALRGPLQNIATQCKGVDRTDEWWSDWLACKLRIAMAHVRRLKLLPKVYAQRVRGLTAGQKATLDEILELYHPTEKAKANAARAEAASGSGAAAATKPTTGTAAATQPTRAATQATTGTAAATEPNSTSGSDTDTAMPIVIAPRRRLTRKSSTDSEAAHCSSANFIAAQDLQQIVMALSFVATASAPAAASTGTRDTPMATGGRKKNKASALTEQAMEQAMQAAPRPAGHKAQAAQVKAALGQQGPSDTAVSAPRKRPRANTPDPTAKITAMKLVTARQPERTYILGMFGDTGKHRLVTEVTAKHSGKHRALASRIVQCIEREGLDKAGAVALRNKLIGRR